MSKPELTPEKRQMIEDLARDLIQHMEHSDGVFDVYFDIEEEGELYTGHFHDNAQSVVEQFLIRQVGKGLL